MKSFKISFFIIATLGITLGVAMFVNAREKNVQAVSSEEIHKKNATNCLECATPSSRAALIKNSITNSEEENPSKN